MYLHTITDVLYFLMSSSLPIFFAPTGVQGPNPISLYQRQHTGNSMAHFL